MIMFRWLNKQPGIQKFWKFCIHYQDIFMTEYHHWINGQTYGLVLITQQSLEENKYGESNHFFDAL